MHPAVSDHLCEYDIQIDLKSKYWSVSYSEI